MSFSDSAGTLTATLGSETPLLLDTGPPSVALSRMAMSTEKMSLGVALPCLTCTGKLPSRMPASTRAVVSAPWLTIGYPLRPDPLSPVPWRSARSAAARSPTLV